MQFADHSLQLRLQSEIHFLPSTSCQLPVCQSLSLLLRSCQPDQRTLGQSVNLTGMQFTSVILLTYFLKKDFC